MNSNIENLTKQNILLKKKLKESKAKLTILTFLKWVSDDIKIDQLRNKIYGK